MIATKSPAPYLTTGVLERSHAGSGSTNDVLLVDVPAATLLGHPAAQQRGRWQGMFDVAVWLRAPAGLPEPLQLLLKYWDENGAHKIVLDRCWPGNHRTVLLNASFSLAATGPIRRAGLYLKATAHPSAVQLDEWHLIPQGRSPRRIS